MKADVIEINLNKESLAKHDGEEIPIYKGTIHDGRKELVKVKGFIKEGKPDKKGQPTKYFYLSEDVRDGETFGDFSMRRVSGVKNGKAWRFYSVGCWEFKFKGLYFPVSTGQLWDKEELQYLTITLDKYTLDNNPDKGYILSNGEDDYEEDDFSEEIEF